MAYQGAQQQVTSNSVIGTMVQPNLVSHTNTANNSLQKLKTVQDLRNGFAQPSQPDLKSVQNLVNSIHINTSSRLVTKLGERKGPNYLSSERITVNLQNKGTNSLLNS